MIFLDHWKGRRDAGRYQLDSQDRKNELTQLPHVGLRQRQRDRRSRSVSDKYIDATLKTKVDLKNLKALESWKSNEKGTDPTQDPAMHCEIVRLEEELSLREMKKNNQIAKYSDIAQSSADAYRGGWKSAGSIHGNKDSLFHVEQYSEITKEPAGKEADYETQSEKEG